MSDRRERHVEPAGLHRPIAIEHDVRAVGGAGLRQRLGERVGRQQAMVAAHRVHVIDETRAGDVGAIVIVAVAGVDDSDLRIVEVSLQPRGRNRRFDAGGRQQGKDVQHGKLLRVL